MLFGLLPRYINKELEEGRPVSSKSANPRNFVWTIIFDTQRKQTQAARASLSQKI